MAATTGTRTRASRARTPEPQPPPEPEETPTPVETTAAPVLWPAPDRYESVHVLQGRILAELPPIEKGSYNEQQKFHFRGIDDAINALNPLLSKYLVRIIPHRILDIEHSIRTAKSGNPVYVTTCRVRFRWYGPNGDYIESEGIGEGTDSLDKATPKAVQGAYKYMIFQALAISTREAIVVDADRGPTAETIHPTLAALIERHEALPKDLAATLLAHVRNKIWNDATMANGAPMPMTEVPESWWENYAKWLDGAEKKAADAVRSAQDADATAPQDQPAVSTPAPEPPAAPSTTPPADPTPAPAPTVTESVPPADHAGPPGVEYLSDEWLQWEDENVELEWDDILKMKKPELNRRLEYEGAMPGGRDDKLEDLRMIYWQVIGGEIEGEPTLRQKPRFKCPVPDCKEFSFSTREERDAHMEVEHDDDGSAEDPDATDPTSDDPEMSGAQPTDVRAAKPAMIDEALLGHLSGALGGLNGGQARAFAKYRREKGLPAELKDYTFDQAYDLGQFLEKLSAA